MSIRTLIRTVLRVRDDEQTDDLSVTALRREVIWKKPFLKQLYAEWYADLVRQIPDGEGAVLELGAGSGFLREYIPNLISSDIFPAAGVKVVLDGQALPFGDGTLKGIVMTGVLHHVPRIRLFFAEAARCIRPGGVVVMVEPWVSAWSSVVYGRFHHEAFLPDSPDWEFASSGPLTGANTALPWMLFARDRSRFLAEFPEWRITRCQFGVPFRYVASGGLTTPWSAPVWSFAAWRSLERALRPWMRHLALFARITLRRQGSAGLRLTGRREILDQLANR